MGALLSQAVADQLRQFPGSQDPRPSPSTLIQQVLNQPGASMPTWMAPIMERQRLLATNTPEANRALAQDALRMTLSFGGADIPPEYRRLQRLEEPGVVPDLNKPHGLYLSPADVGSPHMEPGFVRHDFEASARNPLNVSDVGPLPIRPQAIDSGAGVKALKKLRPGLFDELKNLPKSKLLARASQIEPKVDFSKYTDQQEILEALGAKVAREAGYDALLHDDPQAPEFSEYVALHPSAVRRK